MVANWFLVASEKSLDREMPLAVQVLHIKTMLVTAIGSRTYLVNLEVEPIHCLAGGQPPLRVEFSKPNRAASTAWAAENTTECALQLGQATYLVWFVVRRSFRPRCQWECNAPQRGHRVSVQLRALGQEDGVGCTKGTCTEARQTGELVPEQPFVQENLARHVNGLTCM